ncbi:MAG TPA: NYN domain-containing protein [Ktedonobacteraceae bacterium]|nr:NYN domain-containing protein [Ktedonobacteraceae bacterium]
MTTEHNNLQHSDVDEAVAEQQPVSETMPNPASPEVVIPSEAQTDEHNQGQEPHEPHDPTMNRGSSEVRDGNSQISLSGGQGLSGSAFPFTEAIPLVEADVTRPFTDFIEEFRQAEEARLNSSLRESTEEPFSVEEPGRQEIINPWENTSFVSQPSSVEADEHNQEEVAGQAEEQTPHDTPTSTPVETPHPADAINRVPTTEPSRPVSPLLRPASRVRLPRHSSAAGRQREELPVTEAAQEEPARETASTQEQSRPARRYRFDRPVASSIPAASTPIRPRTEEGKDTTSRGLPPVPTLVDSGSVASKEVKEGNGHPGLKHAPQASLMTPGETQSQSPEQSLPKQPAAPETSPAHGEGTVTPIVTGHDRRHGQARQRGQEQSPAPVPPAATPGAEVTTPVTEPTTASQTTEVALEDLPPLEYSELQRASSRRRRRRRSGDLTPTPTSTTPTAIAASTTKPAVPEPPTVPAQVPLQTPAVTTPRSVAPIPAVPPAAGQYNIVSGYTVGQMNQGNDSPGPFMSPEPSPARGSTPVRGNLRAVRAEVQRTTVYPVRTGDPALNQLANAVVQGIQAQTDRMVNELRRANQIPANISVSLPAFPSTERVGVFVDVANLLYSARTLRITIDFAKLLDFLRGNRRLVRAQAYCPTSPHSSEDQMFLQAVKGLGYRITTKNYKTFSSGAKKADLDLDLCMDVVRLVDGRAVDCIVLVSGDSDFMPMLDYCSDHGVRVEVAAFDEAMSATLRQSCDLFINLAMLEEIRA